ncbi:MAG: flippase-like domain-containing protein [Clostridiales bacterium]|jgi:uncharacterized protein (TIRG00374 family)|nr:flippase-like domain-containing protein [Clostridiales bacterium]
MISIIRSNRIADMLLKLCVAAVLLGLIISKVDFLGAVRSLCAITFWDIVVCGLIYSVSVFVAAASWKVLVWDCRFAKLVSAMLVGHFYSFVLPGQLFGEASKMLYLAKGNPKGTAERYSASIIVDKLTSLLGLLLIGVIGIIVDWKIEGVRYIAILLAALFIAVAVALFLLRFDNVWSLVGKIKEWLDRFQRLNKLSALGMRFFSAWRNFARQSGIILASIVIGTVFQLILVLLNWYVCQALGIPILYHSLCWIHAVMSLVALLPITIGGIGVREVGYAGLFALLGLDVTNAVSVSLIMFAVGVAVALVGGLVVLKNMLIKRKKNGNE